MVASKEKYYVRVTVFEQVNGETDFCDNVYEFCYNTLNAAIRKTLELKRTLPTIYYLIDPNLTEVVEDRSDDGSETWPIVIMRAPCPYPGPDELYDEWLIEIYKDY